MTAPFREIRIGKARESLKKGDLEKTVGSASSADVTTAVLDITMGCNIVARGNRLYGSANLFMVVGEPQAPQDIEYPTILADTGPIELSMEQLLEEIELVTEMLDAGVGFPLLYSLRVLQPQPWSWPSDGATLSAIESNPGRRSEMEIGYIHHEVLYRLSSTERSSLIRFVLSHAELIEVAVSGPSGHSIRKNVRLVTNQLAPPARIRRP
jgi:hypothetical protein